MKKAEFLKIWKILKTVLAKIPENANKNEANRPIIHKNLNIDNSLLETNFKKIFLLFSYSTLDGLSNDTTHISVWWIYRSVKIIWTNIPIWVFTSSAPQEGLER